MLQWFFQLHNKSPRLSRNATDAAPTPEALGRFEKANVRFFISNLNRSSPFADIPDEQFRAVIMGEVIEHIFNHPLGLMKEIARIMKGGGALLLTTPNPSTVMNAMRLLLGRTLLW